MADPESTPPAMPKVSEIDPLVQGLGLLVHNTRHHHWFSATDERETLVAYYALVTGCLTRLKEVTFKLVGDVLTVNGQTPGEDVRYIRELREQMRALHAGNFAFQRGLAIEDLTHFVKLLARDADESGAPVGLAATLTALGVGHVASKTVVYREITSDDVVLSKEALAAMEGAEKAKTPGAVAEAGVLAQLQAAPASGAAGAGAEGVNAVQAMAGDAPRLAGLIVQAAQMQTATGDGLAGALVACVRRTFDALAAGDGGRTQKGRKQVQRQLRELEKQLLYQLDGLKPIDQGACGDELREAVAELEDELQVDTLAVEYARRLKAMEQTEKRLLRYIKARGIEAARESELGARLGEEGVDGKHWQGLIDRTASAGGGGGAGSGAGGGGGAGGGDLAPLLTRMERLADAIAKAPEEGVAPEDVAIVLKDAYAQVGAVTARTAHKIRQVVDDILADAAAAAAAEDAAKQLGAGPRMTRRKLIEMLAEVVQELCQPLAVIKCSIDMIQSKMLGEVSDTQLEMLKLVTESTGKMQGLVDGLQKIAGVPETMSPDRDLLRQVTSS